MKKILLLIAAVALFGCQNQNTQQQSAANAPQHQRDTTDATNNFYDNEDLHSLQTNTVEITGEIANPGTIDFSMLPKRTIIVKETLPSDTGNCFVGAYRYDGYSLFDIINAHYPQKANQEAFPPIIDLYVVVSNDRGESAVFSWGEIYYPTHLHDIMLATDVMRIVPSKTHDLWPLPEKAKMVAGADLLTSRNIESPSKITVHSATREFEVEQGMSPMYSEQFDVYVDGAKTKTIKTLPSDVDLVNFEAIFYGRGRGIHSTTPFTGAPLKSVLADQWPINAKNIQQAYIIVAARDGFRGVYTFSEVFNRNDQSEVLLIHAPKKLDGGAFRLFPAGDFFSDRAIKSIISIWFEHL
ncbi:MAG TPA: hypothetical protein VFC92_03810 [Bacteroidales bacterium]|nr:hypothetical protein [Bacteroidales bacterium]